MSATVGAQAGAAKNDPGELTKTLKGGCMAETEDTRATRYPWSTGNTEVDFVNAVEEGMNETLGGRDKVRLLSSREQENLCRGAVREAKKVCEYGTTLTPFLRGRIVAAAELGTRSAL